jgi:hypothetical protein
MSGLRSKVNAIAALKDVPRDKARQLLNQAIDNNKGNGKSLRQITQEVIDEPKR